jgi:hypothetical protein
MLRACFSITSRPFTILKGSIPVWDTGLLRSSNKPIGRSKLKWLKNQERNPIFSFRKNNRNQISERAVKVKGANEINSRGPRAGVGRMLFMSACDLTPTKRSVTKTKPSINPIYLSEFSRPHQSVFCCPIVQLPISRALP